MEHGGSRNRRRKRTRAAFEGHSAWRHFERPHVSALTFDVRGGRKWAKPACGRPLDGGVRQFATGRRLRQREICTHSAFGAARRQKQDRKIGWYMPAEEDRALRKRSRGGFGQTPLYL